MSGKRNNNPPPFPGPRPSIHSTKSIKSPTLVPNLNNDIIQNSDRTRAYQHVRNSFTKTSHPIDQISNDPSPGPGRPHRIGVHLIGGLKQSNHTFATGFNHLNEDAQNEINNPISKYLNNKMDSSTNKPQSKSTKQFIASGFNGLMGGLLKTNILLEDNDISQSNEHSNLDLTSSNNQSNTKFMFGPNTFSDHDQSRSVLARSKEAVQFFDHHNDNDSGIISPSAEEDLSQVTSQLKLIQQTQDTILTSLRNDIEVVQTENLVLQQSNSRLQNQVSHLTQLVADLTFDLHQMRDIFKSSPVIGVNVPLSPKENFVDPITPPSIASRCSMEEQIPHPYSSFMPLDVSNSRNRKQGSSSSPKDFSRGSQPKEQEKKKRNSSRDKLNDGQPQSRQTKEGIRRYEKSSRNERGPKSRRSFEERNLRNKNFEFEDENDVYRRRSDARKKLKQDKSDDNGSGCFGFFKSNKKRKNKRDRRCGPDSSRTRMRTRESSRSKIPNEDTDY